MEQDEVHRVEDRHEMMVIKLQFRKRRKRKTKPRRSRQWYKIGFAFSDQDTIESVITFRIDSRTIKRENLWLSGYQVPLGDIVLTYAFRNLVC
jgi:hypothetical protein